MNIMQLLYGVPEYLGGTSHRVQLDKFIIYIKYIQTLSKLLYEARYFKKSIMCACMSYSSKKWPI